MKKFLISTAIVSALTFSFPVFAHEGEDHGAHEHAESVSKAANSQEALTQVKAGINILGEMLAAGKLDGMHEEIEKIEESTQALKNKAGFDGEKKTRLEAAVKQLNAQLGKVHTASDAKDIEKTKAELKKAEGALKLVESNFK
ncbi:MAG: hypothetical protein EBR02_05690 [Alphaproteobacteria bacterium]|nr:hypothetical protein [Alphaproteobacteria bacterium]